MQVDKRLFLDFVNPADRVEIQKAFNSVQESVYRQSEVNFKFALLVLKEALCDWFNNYCRTHPLQATFDIK